MEKVHLLKSVKDGQSHTVTDAGLAVIKTDKNWRKKYDYIGERNGEDFAKGSPSSNSGKENTDAIADKVVTKLEEKANEYRKKNEEDFAGKLEENEKEETKEEIFKTNTLNSENNENKSEHESGKENGSEKNDEFHTIESGKGKDGNKGNGNNKPGSKK